MEFRFDLDFWFDFPSFSLSLFNFNVVIDDDAFSTRYTLFELTLIDKNKKRYNYELNLWDCYWCRSGEEKSFDNDFITWSIDKDRRHLYRVVKSKKHPPVVTYLWFRPTGDEGVVY